MFVFKKRLQTSNVGYEEVVHTSPRTDEENFDIAGNFFTLNSRR